MVAGIQWDSLLIFKLTSCRRGRLQLLSLKASPFRLSEVGKTYPSIINFHTLTAVGNKLDFLFVYLLGLATPSLPALIAWLETFKNSIINSNELKISK